MRTLPRAIALLGLAAALLGAGCLADGKCTRNDDCGDGMLCVSGGCKSIECADDSRCDSGEFCNAGLCQASQCETDAQCAENQYCYRHQCLATGVVDEGWALEDINPRSPTYGHEIGASDYAGKVLLLYYSVTT